MGRTYEMAIALSGKVDGSLNSSLLSAAGALAGLEKKLGALDAAQKKVSKHNELKSNISTMYAEYKAASSEVERLAKQVEEAQSKTQARSASGKFLKKDGQSLTALRKEYQTAQTQADKLFSKMKGQGAQLKDFRAEMDKAGISVKNLSQFESDLAAKAAKAARAQSALQKAQAATTAARDRLKFSNMQSELMESGSIFLALKKPIQAAAKFETTMAEIKKVVDFDSPEAFKAMGVDLQQLSMRIPMTTEL
jgi:chromosome segregation ATPase